LTDSGPKTPAELRRFGFVLGTAFALLAALLAWRGRWTAWPAASIAGMLWLAAIAVPAALGRVERAWMGLAERLAFVSTTVVLTAAFFVIVTPIALIRRALGKDELGLRYDPGQASYWTPVDRAAASRPDKPY
jgi:hypothetical protein